MNKIKKYILKGFFKKNEFYIKHLIYYHEYIKFFHKKYLIV
jgi:hypothetical protein